MSTQGDTCPSRRPKSVRFYVAAHFALAAKRASGRFPVRHGMPRSKAGVRLPRADVRKDYTILISRSVSVTPIFSKSGSRQMVPRTSPCTHT